MSHTDIQFYWDIGSTNTYFAFHLLRPLAKKYGVRVQYVPFNLGYVFRHHNYALTDEPDAKIANRKIDLMRWAKRYALPFQVPKVFPIKTSRALRGALVMREFDLEGAYLEAIFGKYWEEGDAGVQDYPLLGEIAQGLGVDASDFSARAESSTIREQLINDTNSALERGIFGAPTIVIENEIYWGKDRFEFIEDHLAKLCIE